MFQQQYNTADVIILGRFADTEALAAAGGSAASIVNLVIGFFVGITNGASIVTAGYFGSSDRKHLEKTIRTSLALSITGGIVLGALGILFAWTMLVWMGTPAGTMTDSVTYLRIYFAGSSLSFSITWQQVFCGLPAIIGIRFIT